MDFSSARPDFEAFLHTAFLRVPAAIAAIGLDRRLLVCNPAYAELVGVDVDELVGSDTLVYVHPEDVDRAITASINRFDAAGRPRRGSSRSGCCAGTGRRSGSSSMRSSSATGRAIRTCSLR